MRGHPEIRCFRRNEEATDRHAEHKRVRQGVAEVGAYLGPWSHASSLFFIPKAMGNHWEKCCREAR